MIARAFLFIAFLLVVAASSSPSDGCFPLTRTWGSGPNGTSLQDWWCGEDTLYGFLGFSYPLEDDCSAYSYASFMNDFSNMKERFGATFVRVYLPICNETSFWVEMIEAARDSSMALIPMIFWDWQQNDPIMYAAENAFLGVFNDSEVGDIAPYIIHSVAFGDELGEQGDYWLPLMKEFKEKLSVFNVPLTITDDWDRDIYTNGSEGLSSFGEEVNELSDLTQAHVMPYYHPDQCPDAYHFWPYFTQQMKFLITNNKRPIFITETMWAYNQSGHHRGSHDDADNMPNYQEYWNTINNNCSTFTTTQIGWFIHSYYGEPGFDMVDGTGIPVFDFMPKRC